jgi:IclR family pca regulon transcriptional regulator
MGHINGPLLSVLPEAELEAWLGRAKLIRYTQYSITTIAQLREEIALVRRQGYAINDQQLEIGLRSVAVPMLARGGKVVAAMNVGVPAAELTVADLRAQILPPLRRAAAELSMSL